MTLQFRDVERDRIVWRDYTVEGEAVKSPFDIDGREAELRLPVSPIAANGF